MYALALPSKSIRRLLDPAQFQSYRLELGFDHLDAVFSRERLFRKLRVPSDEYLWFLHERFYSASQLSDVGSGLYYFDRYNFRSPFLPRADGNPYSVAPPSIVDVWRTGRVVTQGRVAPQAPRSRALAATAPSVAEIPPSAARWQPVTLVRANVSVNPRTSAAARVRDARGWSSKAYRRWRAAYRAKYFDRYHPFAYFDYYHHMPARSGLAPWTDGVFLLMLRRLHSTIDTIDWYNHRFIQIRHRRVSRHVNALFFDGFTARTRRKLGYKRTTRYPPLRWQRRRTLEQMGLGWGQKSRRNYRKSRLMRVLRRHTLLLDAHKRYAAIPNSGRFSSYWHRYKGKRSKARGVPSTRRYPFKRARSVKLRPFVDTPRGGHLPGYSRRLLSGLPNDGR